MILTHKILRKTNIPVMYFSDKTVYRRNDKKITTNKQQEYKILGLKFVNVTMF